MVKLLTILFLFFSLFAKSQATLILDRDFDGGLLNLQTSGNAPTVSSDSTRAGSYAMKTYLHYLNSSTNYRTEVQWVNHDTIGHHYWYAVSILLPDEYSTDNISEIVVQWHGWPDGYPDFDTGEEYWRNPLLALETDSGKWTLHSKWSAEANQGSEGAVTYDGEKWWQLGTHDLGSWIDWVFHFKWNYTSAGKMDVWKNGTQVVDYDGPNCYNDTKGPYYKMGMYKSQWSLYPCGGEWWCHDSVDSRTLYHDELKVAHGEVGYDVVALPEYVGGSSADTVEFDIYKETGINFNLIMKK